MLGDQLSDGLSALRGLDASTDVVLMAEGRVVEEGSHAALMAMEGTYARLFSIQAVAYR